MTYTATTAVHANLWQRIATCGDITVAYDRICEPGSVMLCRALRDAGLPDGTMSFPINDTVSISIPSIHAWADHQPTYRASYFQPRDRARLPWKQCDGIRVEPKRDENGFVLLCQAMRAAGKPDGDMLVVQAHVPEAMAQKFYIPSIHAWAEYRLIETLPTTTERSAKATKTIIADWYRILVALKAGDSAPLDAAHHLTRAALVANDLIDDGTITEAGEAAIVQYEAPTSYSEMTTQAVAKVAATIGLTVNGSATHLVETLTLIDAAIVARSLDDLETMASRLAVTVAYGRGRKGDALKKRTILVAIVNAGHAIG